MYCKNDRTELVFAYEDGTMNIKVKQNVSAYCILIFYIFLALKVFYDHSN
jgi:hypothetical protein